MCVSEVKTDETRDGFKRVTRGKTGEKSGRSGVRQQRVRIVVLICSKLCWHTLFCQTHIKHMYFYIASVLCVCCGCNGELWRGWLILKPKSRYWFNFSFYWYRYTSWIFFPSSEYFSYIRSKFKVCREWKFPLSDSPCSEIACLPHSVVVLYSQSYTGHAWSVPSPHHAQTGAEVELQMSLYKYM